MGVWSWVRGAPPPPPTSPGPPKLPRPVVDPSAVAEAARRRRRETAVGGDVLEFADVELVHEAPAAICCRIADREVWIPKSGLLEAWGLVQPGDRGTVRLSRWAAEYLGLA